MGGWWRWALVSPDGVAPNRMVSLSASVNPPLHHKVQKFSSGTVSPGWSWKKGGKTVVVWLFGVVCTTVVHNDMHTCTQAMLTVLYRFSFRHLYVCIFTVLTIATLFMLELVLVFLYSVHLYLVVVRWMFRLSS